MDLYGRIFRHYTALGWADVRERVAPFAEAIDAYDVQLLPEIEGVAEGAGADAEDILALNLRTEVMFGMGVREGVDGCTALCALPDTTVAGHVIHGQNWDWKPPAVDTCVLLVCAPHDRPAFVTLVEAGLLAKCGMNEAGLGLTANALTSSLDRGELGTPFHAILRRILTSATFEEATDAVTRTWRASSANYLISSRDGRAMDLEAAPGGPDTVNAIEDTALVHANHFLWPDRPFKDLGRIGDGGSLDRQERAEAAMAAGRLDADIFRHALQDHEHLPDSVCAHLDPALPAEADYVTIAALVMDLTDGTMAITQGNPCATPFETYETPQLFAQARAGV
jgi:isopenicillin-N N-acyltransferase-like protein